MKDRHEVFEFARRNSAAGLLVLALIGAVGCGADGSESDDSAEDPREVVGAVFAASSPEICGDRLTPDYLARHFRVGDPVAAERLCEQSVASYTPLTDIRSRSSETAPRPDNGLLDPTLTDDSIARVLVDYKAGPLEGERALVQLVDEDGGEDEWMIDSVSLVGQETSADRLPVGSRARSSRCLDETLARKIIDPQVSPLQGGYAAADTRSTFLGRMQALCGSALGVKQIAIAADTEDLKLPRELIEAVAAGAPVGPDGAPIEGGTRAPNGDLVIPDDQLPEIYQDGSPTGSRSSGEGSQ